MPEASTTLHETDPRRASKARAAEPSPAPPPPGRGGDPGPKSELRRLEEEAHEEHDAPVYGATMADGYTMLTLHHGVTHAHAAETLHWDTETSGMADPRLDPHGRQTCRWRTSPEPRIGWWSGGKQPPTL
ncbi:Hypothetical predicted protein [Pelobates cultripes]|uniref:Uncharacterized protein n=1 Tax=Pelobates cultripes TaxID=61616 RepID=A0AAD1VQ66_PELCU|nr:Hypothetical predicted protein [Pelobates cultripes]